MKARWYQTPLTLQQESPCQLTTIFLMKKTTVWKIWVRYKKYNSHLTSTWSNHWKNLTMGMLISCIEVEPNQTLCSLTVRRWSRSLPTKTAVKVHNRTNWYKSKKRNKSLWIPPQVRSPEFKAQSAVTLQSRGQILREARHNLQLALTHLRPRT